MMHRELLATCWTHAGDAMPVAGQNLSPLDLRARAEAVAAAGFTGVGFTIDDLEAAQATYALPEVARMRPSGLTVSSQPRNNPSSA